MEAAHKRSQQKNIKKQWYPLQIQRNSKTTFIKIVVFFFYLLSFELYRYWMGTYKSKLERFYCLQKHAVYIINFKDRFTHALPLLHDVKTLNIFQINLFYIIFSMFKCKKQMGTRKFPLDNSPSGNCPLDNCPPPPTIPSRKLPPRTIAPRQFKSRKIALR